jgi:peroxiredoxin (alkyl hydroperoxide reductase subunit C)
MFTLVGRKAPDFTCAAVLGNGEITNDFKFSEATKDKYALVFFYPLNFTFVCPSELVALNKRLDKFKKLGVEVIAVSIDSQFSHNAWRNTSLKDGGIDKVGYTMAADVNHRICQSYGVEHPEAGVAFRGAFIIDKAGTVRSQIVNDLPIGRDIDELLRLFESLQFHEEHGEVCPAGWKKDKPGMTATPDGVASYLAANSDQL